MGQMEYNTSSMFRNMNEREEEERTNPLQPLADEEAQELDGKRGGRARIEKPAYRSNKKSTDFQRRATSKSHSKYKIAGLMGIFSVMP